MRSHLLVILATCLLIAADGPKDDATKSDFEAMQGAWLLISLETDGEMKSDEAIKDLKLTIKGDRMTADSVTIQKKMTFVLNSTKTPKQIVTTYLGGPLSGFSMKGIYSLEDDLLKLCFGTKPAIYPTKLETREGDGLELFVFKREPK